MGGSPRVAEKQQRGILRLNHPEGGWVDGWGVLGRAYIMQDLVGIWILSSLGREAPSSAAIALWWGNPTTLLAPGQWEGHGPFDPGSGSALPKLCSTLHRSTTV